MQGYAEANFVDNYEPGDDALVELKNGRFVDAINGRYFAPETRVIIQGKKVKAMPGMPGEPTGIKPDFTIDLQGRAVFPGLFNTHCHASYTTTTVSPEIKDVRLGNKYHQQQLAKNMAECLAHGITNIRDCKIDDLRILRAWKERISRGEIEGPRIYQAVVDFFAWLWAFRWLSIRRTKAGCWYFLWMLAYDKSGMRWTVPSMNEVQSISRSGNKSRTWSTSSPHIL
jgi:hypothetical protein